MISKYRAWDKTTNQMRGCYGINETNVDFVKVNKERV